MNPGFMATRHNRSIGHRKNLERGAPAQPKKLRSCLIWTDFTMGSREPVRFRNLGAINK